MLINPEWYQAVMREPMLMHLRGDVALYVVGCLAIFGGSAWLSGIFVTAAVPTRAASARHDWYVARFLLAVAALLLATMLTYLLSSIGIGNLVSQLGSATEDARRQIADRIGAVSLGWVPTFGAAVLTWGVWCVPRRRTSLSLIGVTAALYLIVTALTLTRTSLIELALPLLAVVVRRRMEGHTVSRNWLIRAAGVSALAGVAFIGSLTMLRGQTADSALLRSLIGYGPASFNRLVAVYDGHLTYPDSGGGYYAVQGVWDAPVVGPTLTALGRASGLELPRDSSNNWQEQFLAVRRSGLQLEYIWGTQVGYILSDLGRTGTLIWHAAFGVLAGVLYALFRRGWVVGIIGYPFIFAALWQSWSLPRGVQSGLLVFLAVAVLVLVLRALPMIVLRQRPISA